ncbi:MAG: ABC transporter permease [Promethearchaeota archaeon]
MANFSAWFVWKKGFKTFTRNKSRTVPILILLVFAITFGTLMFNMEDFRTRMIEDIKEYTNVPDATAYFDPASKMVVENLTESIVENDLEDSEMRMMMMMEFKVSGEEYEGLVIGLDLSKKKHMHALVDNNKKEINDYEFALNLGFAERADLEIGDKISVIYGSIKKEVKIENIGYNAEFQFTPLHSNIAFPSMRPYPILYVDLFYLNEQFLYLNQTNAIVNQFLYQVKDESKIDKVEEKIQDALKSFSVEIVPLEDQAFFKTMREDEESDRRMLLFLTIILLAGAIITLILVMNKLVEEDLKSISVFQALGANKREITASYLVFNIIILSLAIFLGVILSNILAIPFTNFMAEMLGIGFVPDIEFHYMNAIWIGLSLFIVSLISTMLIVKKTFKMDVQQSLKYETKFLEKTNIVEKAYTKVNKDPHPFTKYNLRRLFGKKLHLISLIISLSFSGSLLIFIFGINDGISYSLERKFDDVEQWDCVANTWNYEDESNMSLIMDSLSEIDEYEFAIFDVVLFSKKDSGFDDHLKLVAYEEDSDMHLIEVEEGKELKDDDEGLVTRDILNKFNLEVGDRIYVKSIASNQITKIKIVGVVNDISAMTLFVSINDAQVILNKTDRINTLLITAKDDVEDCAKQVQDLDEIETVVTSDSIEDEINFILEFLTAEMIIFGLILMVFGLILIMVVFKSNTEYRMEDYSNMKALGILDKEIRKSLLAELVLFFCISLILSIVLGNLLLMDMFAQWESEFPGLIFHIYPISYLYYTLIFSGILVFSFCINYRRIKRIDIAEMMRAKTFG